VNSISFLPADTSSSAFNRESPWSPERQSEIAPSFDELLPFKLVMEEVIKSNDLNFRNGFIVESPEKIRKIYQYYSAVHGLCDFPYKKCNAPWVSAVIEPDGSVRPCFFHNSIGNIREQSLQGILNSEAGMNFRKELDMDTNETCRRCVCSLYLSPLTTVR
jgi:MoaA/NifB/PqqE/SkfB family radical SAM enzyme